MIKVLEKHVADKIAAGEVVERPLSVVKELVENSVDAGADSITVEIKNGGKSYIRVTDNGSGINAEEVLVAFMRHATSKITTDKDLESIHTLGFRGEALASIAAVSRVELLTKQADAKLGKRVLINGGTVIENTETGCPDGTTIMVTDLFFNTPARLKFLKSDSAESRVIIDFISQMTLAYPNIRIRLINNDSILFATNGKGDVKTNILTVYSKETADSLVPVYFEREYVLVKGFVSSPGVSNTSRRSQIFFVNGRVVASKAIEKGIADAYSDRLFEGRYPAAFLFVDVEPSRLDVNIHPNKKEVKFDDAAFITETVRDAAREALAAKEAIPQVREKNIFKFKDSDRSAKPGKTPVPDAKSSSQVHSQQFGVSVASGGVKQSSVILSNSNVQEIRVKEEQVDIKNLLSNMRAQERAKDEERVREQAGSEYLNGMRKAENPQVNSGNEPLTAAPERPKSFDFAELRPMGSIFGTYILLTDDDTFYMIDQHAAHERVFFEKLLGEYNRAEKVKQPIMIPIVLNLPYGAAEGAGESLSKLNDMGFEIEEFGPKTYAAKAIPMFMSLAEAEDFLKYFVENTADGSVISDRNKLEKIMTSACKAAVKGGDLLKDEEINELISELSKCENPFSCPHGRPTFIRMRKYEIEKMFKRV